MWQNKKIIFGVLSLGFLLVFILGGGFLAGYNFGKSQCKICPPEEVDFSLFWQSWRVLEEKFINKEKLNVQKMIYGAISGLTQSLEDPYTVFYSPEEKKKFLEEVEGEFEGIGAEIGKKKGELTIIAPLEGTPAQRAGLRAGDKILKINDLPTSDLTIDEAVNLIRGPKGTEVTLTIDREGWEKPQEIKIIRDVISVPSLKWETKGEDIAYIKIYHFSPKINDKFKSAAKEILEKPIKKIILDLRDNPGGYLTEATKVAGWFLKEGQVITIEDFGKGKEDKYYSQGPATFSEYPIVVLVNQGSASASEILASALRDNRDILLIGERTFGKGLVQEAIELKEGSLLKVSVARWLTPKGELISDKGLEPDIKVEMTEKDYESGKDPQLDKAIEVIREMR